HLVIHSFPTRRSSDLVYEKSARFLETLDEDGDPCENLESLRLSVFDSLHEIFRREEFDVRAINFTSYGASFVYIDEDGRPLAPLDRKSTRLNSSHVKI